jgi:hypothetical protein
VRGWSAARLVGRRFARASRPQRLVGLSSLPGCINPGCRSPRIRVKLARCILVLMQLHSNQFRQGSTGKAGCGILPDNPHRSGTKSGRLRLTRDGLMPRASQLHPAERLAGQEGMTVAPSSGSGLPRADVMIRNGDEALRASRDGQLRKSQRWRKPLGVHSKRSELAVFGNGSDPSFGDLRSQVGRWVLTIF